MKQHLHLINSKGVPVSGLSHHGKVPVYLSLPLVLAIFFVFFTATSSCTSEGEGAGIPPNLLLVISDDMGQELGCYGDEQARTPNLDRFANQGIRFANAYVTQSSCSPSRSSILTGLYPHQNGQVGLCHRGFSMHQGIASLPGVLKENGYYTGVMGKIHVAPSRVRDYDFAMGCMDFEAPGNRNRITSDSITLINEFFETEYKPIQFTSVVSRVADTAVAFVREAGGRPFFLHINYHDPHSPVVQQVDGIPAALMGHEEVKPLPYFGESEVSGYNLAGYYNACTRVDEGFRLLMARLEEIGALKNTLVLFIGDHGARLPRGKTNIFEAGLRIPFLMKVPGHEESGVIDALVSTIDIMPTFLDAAGIEIPSSLPGRSVLPLLEGSDDWRTHLFAEFTFHTHRTFRPARSVSDGRYKLIWHPLSDYCRKAIGKTGYDDTRIMRYAETPEIQLFDLDSDPWEFNNLADSPDFTQVREELTAVLKDWMEKTNDPLLKEEVISTYQEIFDLVASGEMQRIEVWDPIEEGYDLFH